MLKFNIKISLNQSLHIMIDKPSYLLIKVNLIMYHS